MFSTDDTAEFRREKHGRNWKDGCTQVRELEKEFQKVCLSLPINDYRLGFCA